jgi:YspA, cpYpsA-related SLOG family
MRLIVCGGRHFRDMALVEKALRRINAVRQIDVIVHGGSAGIGMPVETWGREHDVHIIRYPPCRSPGRSGDSKRDEFMLLDGRPDAVLAFPGGRRTKAFVELASAQRIPVIFAQADTDRQTGHQQSPVEPEQDLLTV